MSASENFLRQFRDFSNRGFLPLTAVEFMEVWNHYDLDGNGYIEGRELDRLLRELVSSVNATQVGPEAVSDSALVLLKETFMAAYDDNEDGRIDITELAGILPPEENFLLLFRKKNPLDSSEDFMKIWKKFDVNCNGFIENFELKNFVRQLLHEAQKESAVSEDQLQEYTDTMISLFDRNNDGKLHLSEMAKLLRVRENYLRKPIFKNPKRITSRALENIFTHYDKNKDGTIEDDELSGFVKDLLDRMSEDYTIDDLEHIRKVILEEWDVNKDGKISRSELRMLLLEQSKLMESHEARREEKEGEDGEEGGGEKCDT